MTEAPSMSEDISQADIERVLELLNASELEDIQYHELSVKRKVLPDEQTSDEESEKGNFGVRPQFRLDGDSFGFRLVGEIESPVGDVRVAVASEYKLHEDAPELDSYLVRLFGNKVGIMALYPFLREAIATLTAKSYGTSLFVPLIQQGEVAFEMGDVVPVSDKAEGAESE